ncbi:MAG TPA: lysophospholipid acyltransferase family protein [Chthoniobacterales bacterium]|nr:lysophospholipid acyltransferase family protein [Chthoniobacterales bacterium]
MKLETWRARALIAVGLGLFRLWIKTLRFHVEDPHGILNASRAEPFILSVWHNRLLLLPPVFSLCFPHRRSVGLISASRDGDFVSILVERFGHGTVRGSTSRKGVIALRQLVDALAAGNNVLITPDGPRGPLYEVNQGIIFVAQKSGAAIVPMQLEYGNAWRLRSWDRFFVPKPFSKVRVLFGPPQKVEPTAGAEEFNRERERIQETLLNLVEEK